jgi:hypothetical protein
MDGLALVQLLRQLDPDARQELRQLLIREQSGRDAAAERLLRRRTPGADALTELIDPSPLTMRLDAGSPAVLVNSACQRFCAQLLASFRRQPKPLVKCPRPEPDERGDTYQARWCRWRPRTTSAIELDSTPDAGGG